MQNGDVLEAMNLSIYSARDINVTFLVQRFVSQRKPPEPIESSIFGFVSHSASRIATPASQLPPSDAELTLPIAARSRPEPTLPVQTSNSRA
jgi:hypothetical protein